MSGRWLAPTLLLGVAVGLLLLTWTTPRPVPLSPGDEPAQEREAQRRRIAQLEQDNARLQVALAAVARRPERALALVVEADLAGALLQRLNQDRMALGHQPLVEDEQLRWLASYRSHEQAANRYYAHRSPTTGETAGSILAAFGGPNCCQVAELIWICGSAQDCGADTIYDTFKASPPHRAAQEDGRYDHFGVGVALDVEGSLLITILVSDWASVQALTPRD